MKHIRAGWLAAAMLAAAAPGTTLAAAMDYAFETTTPQVAAANDAVIAVRLVNKVSGKPVANAVIFQTQLDMSPDGMADMTGAVTPLPAKEPDIYRFKAGLGMAGHWALKLAAKVPGEQETVRGQVLVVTK